MTEDMYSFVDRQVPKKKADRSIFGVLLVAVVLLVGIAVVILFAMTQRFFYRDFTSAMSAGTSAGTAEAVLEGETCLLTSDHSYALYQIFTQNPGKKRDTLPEGEPFAVVTYRNGSVLECWETALEAHVQRNSGICWRFTTSDGSVWIYDTDEFGYSDIWRLVNPDMNKTFKIPQ